MCCAGQIFDENCVAIPMVHPLEYVEGGQCSIRVVHGLNKKTGSSVTTKRGKQARFSSTQEMFSFNDPN